MARSDLDPYLIGDEARRVLVNLAQHYDEWIAAFRGYRRINAGRLTWKSISGREYLYSIVDGRGNGSSLGPRSEKTQSAFEQWSNLRERADHLNRVLQQDALLYKALRLPRIASQAAAAVRKLDEHELLGAAVQVVGTNAVAAYEIEAGYRFAARHGGIDSTQDFDISWIASSQATLVVGAGGSGILGALKELDSTYTVNSERNFQVRNASGYEVEVLLPESLKDAYPARDPIRPIPLAEQDWLLYGTRVEHVVLGLDGSPARLVAPDPRMFALQKLWLSKKPGRTRNKVRKDHEQGSTLLAAIREYMPHYPLDGAFREELPETLRVELDEALTQVDGPQPSR